MEKANIKKYIGDTEIGCVLYFGYFCFHSIVIKTAHYDFLILMQTKNNFHEMNTERGFAIN